MSVQNQGCVLTVDVRIWTELISVSAVKVTDSHLISRSVMVSDQATPLTIMSLPC